PVALVSYEFQYSEYFTNSQAARNRFLFKYPMPAVYGNSIDQFWPLLQSVSSVFISCKSLFFRLRRSRGPQRARFWLVGAGSRGAQRARFWLVGAGSRGPNEPGFGLLGQDHGHVGDSGDPAFRPFFSGITNGRSSMPQARATFCALSALSGCSSCL